MHVLNIKKSLSYSIKIIFHITAAQRANIGYEQGKCTIFQYLPKERSQSWVERSWSEAKGERNRTCAVA
jgi:hypothetical protein